MSIFMKKKEKQASTKSANRAAQQRINSPFGQAYSYTNRKKVQQGGFTPSAALAPSFSLSQSGLANALRGVNQPLSVRYAQQQEGADPFYNSFKAGFDKDLAATMAAAQMRAGGTGNTGSSAYGSALGTVANEGARNLADLRLQALTAGDEFNRNAVATNANVMGGLFGISNPQVAQAMQGYQTSAAQQDQTRLQAQQLNAAAAASQPSTAGQIFQGLGTVAGMVPGGAWAKLGGKLASGIGGLFNRGRSTATGADPLRYPQLSAFNTAGLMRAA